MLPLQGGSKTEECSVQYWNDNAMLPVYEMGRRRGITTAEAIDILLRSNIPSSKVSQDVPTSIAKNLLFVVDLEAPHVKTVKKLLADDMSAWHGMGRKTFFFSSKPPKKDS